MTRPPRPKYPSDAKDYHEIRRPGCAHTNWLPEDLLPTYVNLNRCLGPRTSHADVIRFLFEASEAAIQGVVQSNEFRVVVDSQDDGIHDDAEELDPDVGDVAEDSGESDPETMSEAGIIQGSSSNVMAVDSQVPHDTPAQARVYVDAENAVWLRNKEHKDKLQEQLQRTGRPLVVYVDCRFDSSRSGYHGTLPVINVADDKVIEMVTLTRKETGSSWRIESAALEKALTLMEERGLNISEVIHDDCAQVDCMLAARNIVSQKDLWHKCKNLMSKFKELLQEKRRTPTDSTVEAATTIAQVAVFSVQQLRDYCRQHSLQQAGPKLLLVQRVSVHLNLPEAGGTTEIQRTRPLRYPELASHDITYKLKSWIYTCAKNAALRGDTTPQLLTLDIHNAVDHWAGDHATCRTCRAPENVWSKTGVAVRNANTPKVGKHIKRARKNRVLVDRTSQWKMQLAARVFT
ncbi:hypothetical protein R1sor_018345 [Riccia sorocarpa]|uniref:SAP domain-containing protein n=1 Tax=Riccia sorocarpa TaxID=122646 RepID=A0ABD3I9I9_9MARC